MYEHPSDYLESTTPSDRSHTSHSPRPPQSLSPPPALSHPAPLSSPGITIDHLYFPHIIDLIWLYLDYPGLVACANTSKSWRERATEHFDHVALIVFEDNSVVIRSQNIDHPEVSAVLASDQSHSSDAGRDITDDAINSCTFIDMYIGVRNDLRYARSADAWPDSFLRDLYFDGYPDPSIPGRDATIFLEYFSGHFYTSRMPDEILAPPRALSLTVRCHSDPTAYAPLITESHVNAVLAMFGDSWISDVEHFTIILDDVRHPGRSPGSEFYRNSSCCPSDQPREPEGRQRGIDLSEDTEVPELGSLCELSLLALSMHSLTTLRIVGYEHFTDLSPYIDSFIEALENEASCNRRYFGSFGRLTLIESSTHVQYKGKVGEKRYRLQMRK